MGVGEVMVGAEEAGEVTGGVGTGVMSIYSEESRRVCGFLETAAGGGVSVLLRFCERRTAREVVWVITGGSKCV